jgi:hypothetical protein
MRTTRLLLISLFAISSFTSHAQLYKLKDIESPPRVIWALR